MSACRIARGCIARSSVAVGRASRPRCDLSFETPPRRAPGRRRRHDAARLGDRLRVPGEELVLLGLVMDPDAARLEAVERSVAERAEVRVGEVDHAAADATRLERELTEGERVVARCVGHDLPDGDLQRRDRGLARDPDGAVAGPAERLNLGVERGDQPGRANQRFRVEREDRPVRALARLEGLRDVDAVAEPAEAVERSAELGGRDASPADDRHELAGRPPVDVERRAARRPGDRGQREREQRDSV